MKTVTVAASKTYHIHIGDQLLPTLGEQIQSLGKVQKVCIVSDSNVFPLYGRTVESNLQHSGLDTVAFVFPAGEESKNASTYLNLLNTLAENGLTRNDVILALGGGVVGDLAGFAAATYLRGIRFVQVPTTLLAAVDSSVGGKTAIDLPAGKNLAGAFCQPSLVICDTSTLASLPQTIFQEGCAEVIKYGILYDPSLFSTLENHGLSFPREEVIARCVELKRDIVVQDEFDTGLRMKLNLGHTIGHSIEKISGFGISHGAAVALGMAIIARGTRCKDAGRILALLEKFNLPIQCSYTADELFQYTLSDKKRSGNYVNLIVPESIGNCEIVKTPYEDLKSILRAGL